MLTVVERGRLLFQIKNSLLVNSLSELYSTCLLLFIGIGIVCQFELSHKQLNTWMQINIGWGLAIMFSVYTASKTSGGHLNPAISFMFYTLGKIPFSYVICYSIAQFIGAFMGTMFAYTVYYDQIHEALGDARIVSGLNGTATLFTSMPSPHVSNTIAFIDQFVGTGFLSLFVCAIVDKRIKIPVGMHPLLFGLLVAMIGMAFGMNVGYPINPARDLSPRIFAYFIGYGFEIFSHHDYYFWIPIVAPFFGAIFAAWSYYIFIGFHIPDEDLIVNKYDRCDPHATLLKPIDHEI